MPTTTCPSRDIFLQYSLGLVSEEESHFLAEHLESCPDCQDLVMTLDDAGDTVVGRLRVPLSSESVLAEPQLQRALAAAAAMQLPGAEASEGANLAGVPAPDMPATLGEYRLLEELGRGGMGRVYKALHTKLDRVVAVKVLSRGRVGDRQAIGRFEREMKAVGRLTHANIVQAYDAREIDGMLVLIMEFVDGLDLAELVRRMGPMPVAESCELVRRTALALQCAQEHGLVHRDIKPSNVMLTAPLSSGRGAGGNTLPSPSGRGAGGEGRVAEVKLLDLGLARFYAEESSGVSPVGGEEMTGTGQAIGTADYMAPEQASDSRTVDIRADIYSLGCTLYKLLSGRAPFSGGRYAGALEKMNAHVHEPVPPIGDLAPDVPAELAAILGRMLAKDPADRFATPADVAAAMEPFCRGANLNDLIVRAMAREEGPPSLRESVSSGPLSRPTSGGCPERVRVRAEDGVRASVSPPRRPILRRILIGLAFFGAMAAAFAAGVIITIKQNGKQTRIEVPEGANARVTPDGQLEVMLPGEPNAAEEARKAKQPAVPDEKAIQGTWEVVSSTFRLVERLPGNEDVAPEQVLKTTKVIITADTLKIVGSRVTNMAFDYKLRPAANGNMIDLESRQGVSWGIYQLAASELKICTSGISPVGQPERPSEYWAELGSGKELLVLRRVGDASLSADEKAILGTWRVERLVFPKNNLLISGFDDLDQRVAFSPHAMRFVDAGARVRKMGGGPNLWQDRGYALDPTDQPKRIDFVERLTVTTHAIYELQGDQLTLVYPYASRAGNAPPAKLAAGPDTAMVVLKRVAETTEKAPGQENAFGEPQVEPPVVNAAAELKALQGRWSVVRVEKGKNVVASLDAMVGFDGSYEPPANLGYGNLYFKNGTLDIFDYTKLARSYYTYVIDPAAATKTIDLNSLRGAGPALGIYEIEGDRLRLCLAGRLSAVKTQHGPSKFAVEPESGDILLDLDRYRPSDDERAMQGLWSVAALIEDGRPESTEVLQSLAGYWDADQFTIDRNVRWAQLHPGTEGRADTGGRHIGGQCVLDAAKEPKTISIDAAELSSREPTSSKKLLGIYKFDGGRLTIAYRADGPRPDKFESTPGSTVTLLVLQRPKAPAGAGAAGSPGALIHATSAVPAPPKAAAVPPEVAVVHPVVRQITHHFDFSGQLEAAQTAEIRSRVTGQLAKVLFKPGAMVANGEVLFEIDPAPFEAERNKREADVRLAQLRVDRAKAGSEPMAEPEAALTAAKEELKLAQLNLASTRLAAPISGKIGRPLIAASSLVTDSMPLATIDSVDPMCVVFKLNQFAVLNLRRNLPHLEGDSALSVLVGLPDEKGFPRKTKVESADTRIDPATGTAAWRALLPNADGLLLPGMTVRVRLVTRDTFEELLVPETAIGVMGSYPLPHFVRIVTDQNVVQQRVIEIGQLNDDGMRVVNKGLTADDWVIPDDTPWVAADGRRVYIREGMTVKPLKQPAAVAPSSSQDKPPAAAPAAEMKVNGGR